MQAQQPHWFIQRQCDGSGKNMDGRPSIVVYVNTVVKKCDAVIKCCLCNKSFDDYGRWNVFHCYDDALFYLCPDKDCGDFMSDAHHRFNHERSFMQYADSDVWYMLECTYST